jgi:hypothetical protein
MTGALHNRHQISGNYQGIPVEVFIKGRDAGDDPMFYTYHLKLKVEGQGVDWAVRFGDREFFVECKDEAFKRRLTEAVAVELVQKNSGDAKVQYRVDEGTLEYEKSVAGEKSVPTVDEFEAQFKLLTHLADLNEKLNT